MTIVVDPQQLNATSGQFVGQYNELQALVQNAKSQVSALEGAWQGNRANKFFGDWASMQPNLEAALQTLDQTAQLLRAAASDFAAADLTGL